MNRPEFVKVQEQARGLAYKKNHDYGDYNITKFGLEGVVVRLSDKVERLIQIVWENKGEVDVDDERIEDTLMDLMNYATIGYLVHKGKWEK